MNIVITTQRGSREPVKRTIGLPEEASLILIIIALGLLVFFTR